MAERLRIAVLDIAASKTGALSVLRDLYSDIRELDHYNEWIFITGGPGILKEDPETPNIRVISREDVKKNKVRRLLFDRLEGRKFLSHLNPDIVFSMQNTLPTGTEKLRTPAGKKVRTVIYLHQPLGFQKEKNFSFFNRWEREAALYQHLIAPLIDRSLKKADKIIVQTGWMKEAVIRKLNTPSDRVDVIPPHIPELEHDPDEALKREPGLFFYPAGSIIYKDHQCIVDAAEILVKKGVKDFKVLFTEKAEDLPWLRIPECVKANLVFNGPVRRSEMASLYKRSVLLFPSYIETFGYPLAEGRSLDTPVIAADTPFARELLNGYERAEYFHVSSAEELAGRMKEHIYEEI